MNGSQPRPEGGDGWDAPSVSGEHTGAAESHRESPRAASDQTGDPRFEERDALGAGGGGRVVRGVDRHLERDVALKIVGPDNPQALARLRREASILVALEHPGIVPLYDLIERPDGGLQLALRIVRGRSLERALADDRREGQASRRTPERLRHLARAAEAVAWAHHEGFVHRDLKPANVMVGDFGEIQVIDWGLAARLDEHEPPAPPTGATPPSAESFEPGLTRAGAVLGTPRYMSPEQARGERVDQRADVWSLGAILFEIVAGRPAFAGAEVEQVLDAVREGRVPALKTLAPRAPPELVAIASRAMALDPEHRYMDARGLAEDLNAYLDGRPVAAHRYALGQRLARFIKRRRMPLAVLGGLGATALAFSLAPRGPAEIIEDTARAEALADDLAAERRGLAAALTREAEERLLAGALPEAAAAAARALTLAPTPGARGVIALAAGADDVRLLEETPLSAGNCLARALHPDGVRWLCRRGDEVVLLRDDDVSWRHPGQVDGAAFTAGGARVALFDPGRHVIYLDVEDGRPRWRSAFQDCGMSIVQGAGAELAILSQRHCLVLLDGERTLWAATGLPSQVATAGRDRRWAALGYDATLTLGAFDPAGPMTRPETPRAFGVFAQAPTTLGDEAIDASALALVADEVVIGTLRGALIRLGFDGDVRARTTLRDDVPVVAIEPSPSGGALAVVFDRGGPVVLARQTLQVRGVLPEGDRGAIGWRDDHRFTSISASRLARWELGESGLGALHGLTGLVTFAVDDHRLAAAHDRHVTVFDRRSGAVRARASSPNIVKSVALHPSRSELAYSYVDAKTIARFDELVGPLAGPAERIARRLEHTASGTLVAVPYLPELWLMAPTSPSAIERVAGDVYIDLTVHGEGAALLTRTGELVRLDLTYGPVELARCAWPGTLALTATADGETFVAALDDEVVLIDSATCAVSGWLDARSAAHPVRLTDVQVSADGRWIGAGAREGLVFVWRDRALVAAVRAHAQRVARLAFTPDSRHLYSAGWDGAIQSLDLERLADPDAVMATWPHRHWGL